MNMPLQFIEMLNGASGYKNVSNSFIWCYSQVAVTMTDAQGQAVKETQAPCWVPPNWTINTGTSTDRLFGIQGSDGAGVEEFRGFLSRTPSGIVAAGLSAIAATVAIRTTSAPETEFEVWANGASVAPGQVETEIWTHVP
jgi:hypothetical protein